MVLAAAVVVPGAVEGGCGLRVVAGTWTLRRRHQAPGLMRSLFWVLQHVLDVRGHVEEVRDERSRGCRVAMVLRKDLIHPDVEVLRLLQGWVVLEELASSVDGRWGSARRHVHAQPVPVGRRELLVRVAHRLAQHVRRGAALELRASSMMMTASVLCRAQLVPCDVGLLPGQLVGPLALQKLRPLAFLPSLGVLGTVPVFASSHVLVLEEVVFVLFELLLGRDPALDRAWEMTWVVKFKLCAEVALEALAIEVLDEVDAQAAGGAAY